MLRANERTHPDFLRHCHGQRRNLHGVGGVGRICAQHCIANKSRRRGLHQHLKPMLPDPFFRLETLQAEAAARCEKFCPLGLGGCFCGARIHADCLHIGSDGSVRVSLSAPAEEWFNTLHELGEVLHLSRNHIAVLGTISPLPALADWRNPVLPRDLSNGFTPNLGQYASLWAVREPSPAGTAYGLEARDVTGHIFQKIVLTAPARRELFEQFVITHQSPVSEAGNWYSPNHAASVQRCHVITQRVPYLRSRQVKGVAHVRQLPVGILPHLLTAAAKLRLPLRTAHYNPALNTAVVWTPNVPDAPPNEMDGIAFYNGDSVGLHLALPAVTGVWLWQGRCKCCDKQHWTIEVGDGQDHIGLAITVGDERFEADWRELLMGELRRTWSEANTPT